MPKLALKYPYVIILLCLVTSLIGVVSIAGMPVNLFPQIDIPGIVVANFYAGMPEQYAPVARGIIGSIAISIVVTMFLVPVVYLVVHSRRETKRAAGTGAEL